jgi:hypothetical protein
MTEANFILQYVLKSKSYRQQIAQQTEAQRELALRQQQQQREDFNNLIANINSLANTVGEFQNRQNSGSGNNSAGRDSQASSSSGSSSSSSRNNNNFDISRAKAMYDRYEKNAISAYNNIKSSGDYSAQQRQTFQQSQGGMRNTRQEAERNGYTDIKKSKWEDEPLP